MQGATPVPRTGIGDSFLAPSQRPDVGGRKGHSISLFVNHVNFLTPPAAILYFQYDVAIERVHSTTQASSTEGSSKDEPGTPSAPNPTATSGRGATLIPPEQNRRVYAALAAGGTADLLKLTAYDGRKIAFSTRDLQGVAGVAHEVQAPNDDGRLEQFKITLSHTTGVNSAAFDGNVTVFLQGLVAALDIAMRQSRASDPRFLTWVSSVFKYDVSNVGSLGEGCSAWRDYYQSVRPTQSGLIVNIDVSHSAFFDPQPVMEFARKLLTRGTPLPSNLSRERIAQLTTAIKSLRVRTSHGQKISYKVLKLGQSPRDATISILNDSTGDSITVEEYFLKKYNIRLQHPTLPCIVATRKKNHIPMELCSIPDGSGRNWLPFPHQTVQMIRVAAMKPNPGLGYACTSANNADFSRDPICREYRSDVRMSKVEVQARILPPPNIVLGGNKTVTPKNGAWRIPPQEKYYTPSGKDSPLLNWAVIKYDRNLEVREARNFIEALCRQMIGRGMIIGNRNPKIFEYERATASCIPGQMKNVVETMNRGLEYQLRCQLLLIIVHSQDTLVYNAIKKTGDCELGIPTQVMLAKHAVNARGFGAYTDNICLKINIKLGGMNFWPCKEEDKLLFENSPFMVLGADVTHPPPGSKAFPSIAAMVGSMDSGTCRYYGVYRSQEPGMERSDDVMQDMLCDILLRFLNLHNRLPEVVLMFRDGVSEGQFSDVMTREVEAMRRSFNNISESNNELANYRPRIVFIVVQKRHHTRFTQVWREADKSKNVPAGTVVNGAVYHPNDFDYYTFSHADLQGPSVPAHYNILYDELGLGSEALQSFSFRLCHAVGRASRFVSLPAPVYYSHLLACRARCFVPDPTSAAAGASTAALAMVHEGMSSSMHYV